jgi:hypothetical protein
LPLALVALQAFTEQTMDALAVQASDRGDLVQQRAAFCVRSSVVARFLDAEVLATFVDVHDLFCGHGSLGNIII